MSGLKKNPNILVILERKTGEWSAPSISIIRPHVSRFTMASFTRSAAKASPRAVCAQTPRETRTRPQQHAWRSVPLATQVLTGCTLASLQSRPANGSLDLR